MASTTTAPIGSTFKADLTFDDYKRWWPQATSHAESLEATLNRPILGEPTTDNFLKPLNELHQAHSRAVEARPH